VLQDCNLSTGEAEEEELQVLGQPGLQRNIQSLKTKQNKKTSERKLLPTKILIKLININQNTSQT
jgi:hypothetical protein